MIEFDYLCQAINDWREGKRPAAPVPSRTAAASPYDASEYEEVHSGIVMMEEASEADQGYADQAYAEPDYGGAPASIQGADQTQAYVPDEYDLGADDYEEDVEDAGGYAEASAVDADEDYERDYDLEAQDDFANFDVASDIASWFVAHMRIEQAWEDAATREALFAEYGIRDRQHFHQVQATMDRYVQSEDAAARYGGFDQIMQLQMNARQDYTMRQMQHRAETELAGEFEPVEGIGLDEWAQCQAHIASGGSLDEVIEALGVDQETWDRVSAEWNARMSRDTTATIATAYGKAFSGAGAGQYGAAGRDAAQAMTAGGDVEGDAPIPLERFVEIEQAQAAAAEQGRDPSEVLAEFGMTPMDWGTVGGWWGQYIARHAMENGQALFHRYSELQQHYAAQYGVGSDADEDIDY